MPQDKQHPPSQLRMAPSIHRPPPFPHGWRAGCHDHRKRIGPRDEGVRAAAFEGARVDWIFPRLGRSLTVPSLTSLPISDRRCFLAGGRSDLAASSLLTGDQSALRVAAVPWGLLSLGFPRVPFLFLRGVCWGAGVERRPPMRGIYAGQRPAALVGVTGFEPAASSSRTKRATKLRHTPWPAAHIVMRAAMHETSRAGLPAPNRVRTSAARRLGGEGQQGRLGSAGEPHRRIRRCPQAG
jgi:hypothetical protein